MRNHEMKWYLSGPMSGIAQFNILAFDEATKRLRDFGYDIFSPAEHNSPEYHKAALKSKTGDPDDVAGFETWGEMLARDVELIADEMDGVILLSGWEESRGARLEAYVGLLTDKEFAMYRYDGIRVLKQDYVADRLQRKL